MSQDCKKLFMVPSFSIILLAQSIAAVGASGTGYQILYIEVSLYLLIQTEPAKQHMPLKWFVSALFANDFWNFSSFINADVRNCDDRTLQSTLPVASDASKQEGCIDDR